MLSQMINHLNQDHTDITLYTESNRPFSDCRKETQKLLLFFFKLTNSDFDFPRKHATVEPQFNEVPRDWGNWFIISWVCSMENLNLINLWKNHQNICYIKVQLIVAFFFLFFFLWCDITLLSILGSELLL